MKKIVLILILFLCCSCGTDKNDGVISYIEAKEKIINNGAILVDVRSLEEYNSSHIDGSFWLSLDEINEESALDLIDSFDSEVIVYCKSGNRSSEAKKKLEALGYKNVYDLGSISNWEE